MIELDRCTGYQWCLDLNIRILDLSMYNIPTTYEGSCMYENDYYEIRVTKEDFLEAIQDCRVKPNSMPRKTPMYLEYRMYGLVPYNMSPIQQGIQFGHAVVDYGRTVTGIELHESIYNKWADKDKTFIILNGGTTNTNPERLGTLNQHMITIYDNSVLLQPFYEPDLGDQLTAVVFLVDERVFDREMYPDFIKETLPWSRQKPSEKKLLELEEKNAKNYASWVDKVGGEKNAFLREFLKGFRLA